MEKETRDLVVETQGRCFLCSSHVSILSASSVPTAKFPTSHQDKCSSSLHSIHYLVRFLNMDMRKVFFDNENISANLLSKVENSKLKVELCTECVQLNESFSRRWQQLEKIKMEMTSCLQVISDNLNIIGIYDRNWENLTSDGVGFMSPEKLQIVKALRSEAKKKCSTKLSNVSPKVGIKNYIKRKGKRRKVTTQTIRMQNMQPCMEEEPEPQDSNAMSEDEVTNDDACNSIDPTRSDPDDDNLGDPCPAYSSTVSESSTDAKKMKKTDAVKPEAGGADNEAKPEIPATTVDLTFIKGKSTLNLDTGKHCCNDCSAEFAEVCKFYAHYRTKHLKIRIKCSLCEKQYHRCTDLDIHHEATHSGVQIRCGRCNKEFSLPSQLVNHRRSNQCGTSSDHNNDTVKQPIPFSAMTLIRPPLADEADEVLTRNSAWNPETKRHKCHLCLMEFERKHSFTFHFKAKHRELRYKCTVCGKEFLDRCGFTYHYRRVHMGATFDCRKCKKSFQNKYRLAQHTCEMEAEVL